MANIALKHATGPRDRGVNARRERALRRDLKTLALFVETFCAGRHHTVRRPAQFKTHDLAALYGRAPRLCGSCRKLLAHALVKRTACPLDPKPMCKKCPTHCYAPKYREQMREVMKYSGRKLVMSGRIHYLVHLWW